MLSTVGDLFVAEDELLKCHLPGRKTAHKGWFSASSNEMRKQKRKVMARGGRRSRGHGQTKVTGGRVWTSIIEPGWIELSISSRSGRWVPLPPPDGKYWFNFIFTSSPKVRYWKIGYYLSIPAGSHGFDCEKDASNSKLVAGKMKV